MNYLRYYGSWLMSENGKKFSMALTCASGAIAFGIQYLPNTVLLDKYKEIASLYSKGIHVPVSKELEATFNKAIELAEIPEVYRKYYSTFNVCGFDLFSAGTSSSKFGCIIGLPVNFSYKTVETIDKHNLKIRGESVVWDTQEAQSFLESLVMSEKAKIYGIAREARMLNTDKLLLDSSLASLAVLMIYRMSYLINKKYSFLERSRGTRFLMYGFVTTFFIGNYLFIRDAIQLFYEKKIDQELKDINPIFTEGAVEFYSKILQRNRALRFILEKEGENLYTITGNENYFIRQMHLPLVQRKDFFEKKVPISQADKTAKNIA